MSNRRIEMLALGIATLNDAFNPSSDAFQLFNWGLSRAYSFKHLSNTDDKGRRIFSSVIGGFRFLVQDLEWKCNGDTRAKGNNGKLKSTSNLSDLLLSYKIDNKATPEENVFQLVDFLTRALNDDSISTTTELRFFTSEDK